MGGTVIPVNSTHTSHQKGETLSDTIRCMDCYCDVLVLRHPIIGSANEAATASSVPVLNAGDGKETTIAHKET
jgi:aspartate carbamoyltransferase catalytic subunit